MVLPLYKIGIIGDGNHSKRIQKILEKKKLKFIIYKPARPNYSDKKSYIKLLNCDAIFIISPNDTHFKYIKEFSKSNIYIFCEKPPLSKKSDLIKLRKINHKKIYYNFNFRFSKLSQILSSVQKYNLGKFLYSSIIVGQSLAFTKEFKINWRSNKKKIPTGIYEIVGVHWIDLINYFFGIKKLVKKNLSFKKIRSCIDNTYINIQTKENKIINIYCSYTSPLIVKKKFIFQNGYINQTDNLIEIRGPANYVGKNNMFIKSPLIKKISISDRKDYEFGLTKSVDYFLNVVKKKGSFNKKDVIKSLQTNSFLF